MPKKSKSEEVDEDGFGTEPEDSDIGSDQDIDGEEDDAEHDRSKSRREREAPERLARTIFVSNLPKNVKKKEILRLFRDCGRVESARIRGGIPEEAEGGRVGKRVAVIRREFASECHSLRAYVVFEKLEAVEKALALSGSQFLDRHIFVDRAHRQSANIRYNNRDCVFIGNLPFSGVDDEALVRLFTPCGSIRRIRIVRDRDTGMSRGFAYVEFAAREAVQSALKLNGTELAGRSLRVSRCQKGPKRKHQQGKNEASFSKSGGQKKFNRPMQKTNNRAPKADGKKQPPRTKKPTKGKPRMKTNRGSARFFVSKSTTK